MAYPGSYKRYWGDETKLHVAIANFIRHKYPKVLMDHSGCETKLSPSASKTRKAMGHQKGIPDLMLYQRSGKFVGLAIEVKIYERDARTRKYNKKTKPTKIQVDIMERLEEQGWKCQVVWTIDEAMKLIDTYMQNPKSLYNENDD